MSAIITQRFRKNNVQNIFNEMMLPVVAIAGCASSGTTVTPSPANVSSALQIGMAVTTASGTGVLSTAMTSIVTSVSSTSFQIYPTPTTPLSGATLNFYSQYYIGIGKSDPYNGDLDGSDTTPGSPVAAMKTEVDVKNNLIALQKVSIALNTASSLSVPAIYGNAGYVLPRYNWTPGSYFKAYDPTDPSCLYPTTLTNGSQAYPCYAVYDSGTGPRLYICAASAIDSSSQQVVSSVPSGVATILGKVSSNTGCGYRWVYVANLGLDTAETLTAKNLTTSSGNTSSTLDSNQFFKIYRQATSSGSSATNTSSTFTNSAGGIYSYRIVSAGLGYKKDATFVVDGNGTGATGQVTSTNSQGAILSVCMNAPGQSYSTGTIRFTYGTGSSAAVILPRIAPINGFGYDVVSDLPAWYAGFYANFTYDAAYPGGSDVPAQDQIRQISLIRNPVVFASTSGSSITYRCLKSLTVNADDISNGKPTVGDVVESITNGARGFIDHVNTSAGSSIVYYHQNSSTFGAAKNAITPIPFANGTGYTIWTKASNYVSTSAWPTKIISAVTASEEYVGGTGDVLYVQNRVPMTQAPDQSEPITIVTQF